jgi:dienelactone hydrolase
VRALALVAAAAAVLAVPAVAVGGFPRFGAGCARDDFRSGAAVVRAELCRATGGRGAAVLVLHGCGGFSTFDHRLATEMPRLGVWTLDVDYFGPTPPPGRNGFCGARGAFGSAFPTWIRVARDAAATLRRTPGIRRVGAVGWSLGGGVVVAAALAGGRPFAAIAGFSTGAFGAEQHAAELPPTILLSGGATDAIPVSETRPLYDALRAAHVPTELYVYPHGEHTWPGRQGALGIARAAAFLRRYLG